MIPEHVPIKIFPLLIKRDITTERSAGENEEQKKDSV